MLSAPLLNQEESSDVTNYKTSPSARHEAQDTGPIVMTTRTEDGGFTTTEGTLHVSKPFRSRSTKKLRAMITFEPRKTHFDTTNEASGTNEFRVRLLRCRCVRWELMRRLPGFLHTFLDIIVSVHSTDLC
jgi:sterol O-acyltransferase